jgi:predicted  nucleic acid-binding Zn-ribbon protein
MRTLLLAAVSALALAGCGERTMQIRSTSDDVDTSALKVVTQLQCPEHQGALTRVRTAPDGLSCDYAGPRGAEVTLRLVKVGEDAESALAPIETELNALLPGVAQRLAKAEAEAQTKAKEAADEARQAADEAREAADSARTAAASAQEAARAEADAAADSVDVNLPGVKVKTEGESARVNLPGIHIEASDSGGAHVNIGGVRIDADEKGAGRVHISSKKDEVTVRSDDDASEIRAHKRGGGVRATYILVDEKAPDQSWKLVGYEARGPATGPLVVAVVRSKNRKQDAVFNAAKALVKSNAGG